MLAQDFAAVVVHFHQLDAVAPQMRDVQQRALAQLLVEQDVKMPDMVTVEINGNILKRDTFDATRVEGGAEVVLFVDDEEPVRRLVRRILGKHGYTVLTAEDADTARAACEARPGGIDLAPPRVDEAFMHIPTTTGDDYEKYEIEAVNEDVNDVDGDGDTSEACAGTGTYTLFLDVVAEGGTVVATRTIFIDVP